MVRPSGTRGTGSTLSGQADLFDELRARVSSWPPLRPARLRRERGSVGVVLPTAPVDALDRGAADATCDRHGYSPHFCRSGDLGGWPAAPGRAGGDDPFRVGEFRPRP